MNNGDYVEQYGYSRHTQVISKFLSIAMNAGSFRFTGSCATRQSDTHSLFSVMLARILTGKVEKGFFGLYRYIRHISEFDGLLCQDNVKCRKHQLFIQNDMDYPTQPTQKVDLT